MKWYHEIVYKIRKPIRFDSWQIPSNHAMQSVGCLVNERLYGFDSQERALEVLRLLVEFDQKYESYNVEKDYILKDFGDRYVSLKYSGDGHFHLSNTVNDKAVAFIVDSVNKYGMKSGSVGFSVIGHTKSRMLSKQLGEELKKHGFQVDCDLNCDFTV